MISEITNPLMQFLQNQLLNLSLQNPNTFIRIINKIGGAGLDPNNPNNLNPLVNN